MSEDINAQIDELIKKYSPNILQDWNKDLGIDEVEIKKQFIEVRKRITDPMKEDELWNTIQWIARIDLKNKTRGSSMIFVGYCPASSNPKNWITPKKESALNIYFNNREEAIKKGMVREMKDPDSGEIIPIVKYWWEKNRQGKDLAFRGRDLPPEEDGWMQTAYGIAIPLSELISGYDKLGNYIRKDPKEINWKKLMGFELSVKSEHANPESKTKLNLVRDGCVEFSASGKIAKIDILKNKVELYQLNTSTKTEAFKPSNLLNLNAEQIVSYFGRPFITPDKLIALHTNSFQTYNTSKQYGNIVFITSGTIADITLSTDPLKSHMLLLEHEKLTMNQKSVTVWLPNDIKFDYGKYSLVYVIGTTTRRLANEEWEFPQIQGLGIIPIRKVKPTEDLDKKADELFKSISDDSFVPEQMVGTEEDLTKKVNSQQSPVSSPAPTSTTASISTDTTKEQVVTVQAKEEQDKKGKKERKNW